MEIKDEIKELRESTGMNRKEYRQVQGTPDSGYAVFSGKEQ